jgi:hypothetical protein
MAGCAGCPVLRVSARAMLAITLLGCLWVTPAWAQTARLAGIVRDSSGAVIAGAQLVLENEATGSTRRIVSNELGMYTFPLLTPGTYRLTTEAPSFKRVTKYGLELTVGQNAGLDISLDVAAVADAVSVEGQASLVNSHDASVGMTLDRAMVESLPLNGRTFQSLIALSPGVTLTPASGGPFSANGQRTTSNYFTIDGVSANIGVDVTHSSVGQSGSGASPGFGATGGTNTLVSMDAFREVRVLTSTFAPEYGRTPGAQVSIVTRAGTNALSGSGFEYFRSDRLDATDWFTNYSRGRKPSTSYNNFGGVLGGPIKVNRAFFFASYEGQRLDLPAFASTFVPSLASRQSASADLRPFLNAFPLPTGPDLADGTAELKASFARPSDLDAISIRGDLQLSRAHTMFVRYSDGASSNMARGGPAVTNALNLVQVDKTRTRTATFGATSVLTPSVVNDARLNYSTHRATVAGIVDDFGGAVPFDEQSLIPAGMNPAQTQVIFNLIPAIGGILIAGPRSGATQQQFNVTDTLSYIHGSHEIKAGFDYRRLTPQPAPPQYTYNYLVGGVTRLLQHSVTRATITLNSPSEALFQNASFFAQDTYKLTPRATITYGLRYEVNPAPTSQTDVQPLVVTGAEDPKQIRALAPGSTLWPTAWTNIAPRIGGAYQLSTTSGRELVLRSGWGIFYDLAGGRAGNVFGDSYPYKSSRRVTAPPFPLSSADLVPPDTSLSVPGATEVYSFANNLKLPRTYQWNVTLEQALGAVQSVSVAYVGAVGRNLLDLQSYTYTATNPDYQVVDVISNASTSDYHALQVHYERRLSHNLQGLLSYTWGHSIDTESGQLTVTLPPTARLSPQQNRASSDFDVRHAVNFALSYRVPDYGKNAASRALFNGWQLDLMGFFRTGVPVTPVVFRDIGYGSFYFRPDPVPGVPQWITDPTVPTGRRINPQAFVAPTELRQGTLGRNTLRATGLEQFDLAFSRWIPLGSHMRTQLRAEIFNVLNHPNFGPPYNLLGNAVFGYPSSTLASSLGFGSLLTGGGLNPVNQVGGPRSVQLSARVQF